MDELSCPDCNHALKSGSRLQIGQRLTCPNCQSVFTISRLVPVELESYTPQKKLEIKVKRHTLDLACPECNTPLKLRANLHLGQQLECPTCRKTLEVVSTNPLELDIILYNLPRRDRPNRPSPQNGPRKFNRYWKDEE